MTHHGAWSVLALGSVFLWHLDTNIRPEQPSACIHGFQTSAYNGLLLVVSDFSCELLLRNCVLRCENTTCSACHSRRTPRPLRQSTVFQKNHRIQRVSYPPPPTPWFLFVKSSFCASTWETLSSWCARKYMQHVNTMVLSSTSLKLCLRPILIVI